MDKMSLEFEGPLAVLKFNHPEVMNAIGAEMLDDFMEAILEIKKPANGARCLLLTGEGRGFCAGANLQDNSGSNEKKPAGSKARSVQPAALRHARIAGP